ncbi:DMT family transporter [Oceanicella sp. SM1341]|uniref:DMT family transporter n=1 Tax=Oceanicella sp. SM1341 TaxID=1548889 RepID=UPI001300A154|nr:DMT family transporter [Oceanicella sp. SM1341]
MPQTAPVYTLAQNMRGAGLMVSCTGIFTLHDALMKLVAAEIGLWESIFLRGCIASALLAAFTARLDRSRLALARADRRALAWRTVGEMGSTLMFLAALSHIPFANATAILQVAPLAMTLAAALLLRERVGWRRSLAIAVGFGGVMLIVRPGTEGFTAWSLSALGAVGFLVMRDFSTRALSPGVPSVLVAFVAATSLTLAGAAGLAVTGWTMPSATAALQVGLAGLLVTAGYILITMAMRAGDMSFIAPFRYTALVWALGLGVLLFGDFPAPLTFAGAGLVVATGIFTFLRERALGRRAERAAAGTPPR